MRSVLGADDWLEPLHVQTIAATLALPVLADRVEHLGRAADESLALAPIAAQRLEILWAHAPHLVRKLLVEPEPGMALREVSQLEAEDHVLGRAPRMQVHDIRERAAAP